MKRLLFFCLTICCIATSNGQNLSLYIPNAETYSSTSIAQYVQANFKTDRQKVSAIYGWVTANIRYDTDSMYNINWGPDPELKVSAALRRKKGVCENFASVFSSITLKCGIPSFVINGYTRMGGYVKKAGHAWSAVYLDNEWLLCDPTWDIGQGTNYFLASPNDFIDTHMPFDPLWQLLAYPITQEQFNRGNFYAKKDGTAWNINDSINTFLQLDSVNQLEASAQRMKRAGIQNEVAKGWRSYIDMKIAIVYGDNDMNLYNGAVADLNKANKLFNNYVQYRNNQFTPVKTDADISALLDPIPGIIIAASKKVDKIGLKTENFQYDTGGIKSRLSALTTKVIEQQNFLKQYFESSIADRGKLFYK